MSDHLDWISLLPGWRPRPGGGVLAAGFDWEASVYFLEKSNLFELQVRIGAETAVLTFDSVESAAGEVINRLRAKRDEHERRVHSLNADCNRLRPNLPKREPVPVPDIFFDSKQWPVTGPRGSE